LNDQENKLIERRKKSRRWFLNFLWLIPAFVPAAVSLCWLQDNNLQPSKFFWALNGFCSLIAGVGFWRGLTKERIVNGVGGLGTGALIFVLNIAIAAVVVVGLMLINLAVAFYQGCCKNQF
jgi:hypothetical protein